MKHLWLIALALVLCASASVRADTLFLKNGVQVDGVVKQMKEGVYQVTVGDRKLIYREKEILKIEKNAKSGGFDKEKALERAKQRDADLTALTGLNAEQRRQVKRLAYQLKSPKGPEKKAARDKLIALQQGQDIVPYLLYLYPDADHHVKIPLMEILCVLDRSRALPIVLDSTRHVYYEIRAKALELLGRLGATELKDNVFSGLVDHHHEVRIMAAYATANLGAREATPVLVEGLKFPDLRVSNASREALVALWQDRLGEKKPQSVDEWKAFWSEHGKDIEQPLDPAKLIPLILEEEEFEDE